MLTPTINSNIDHIITILIIVMCMASCVMGATRIFNVMNYGAVGNGRTDDSHAFLNAWKAACQSPTTSGTPVVLVPPRRTFFLSPITFNGPCKSSRIYMLVSGNLVAPIKTAWRGKQKNAWIIFYRVNGLVVKGKGGQNCKGPTGMIFRRCNGLRLDGFSKVNGPGSHILIMASNDAVVSNLQVIAPGDSPNTDGIAISSSTNVQIRNSFIATGDDCIAISAGSSNIGISGITCGPGHGISIGSLGSGGYDTVENVRVRNCTLKQTLTGVRIKSLQEDSTLAHICFSEQQCLTHF
ncbi:Polygalacturonase [Handroanthus impetiginosus]|uniref:Polygalacturonase n=1 Tax=Handroanthus impetiginosus TaxID=429701 RepID=A0A2G9G0P3_9LAMI|nr:Polygalacturonase [Handroanthus impetiginosus]